MNGDRLIERVEPREAHTDDCPVTYHAGPCPTRPAASAYAVAGTLAEWEADGGRPSDFSSVRRVSAAVDEASPAGVVVIVEDEDRLFDLLDRLNNNGHQPELSCLVPGGGSAFVATLTDPDAGHVEYVYCDESGRVHCCGCHEHFPRDCKEASWRPPFPVLALASFDVAALPNPNAEPVDTTRSDAEAADDTRPTS